MAKKKMHKLSGSEKIKILKRHLQEKEAVSDICEELSMSPNQYYRWQSELFDKGALVFENQSRSESLQVRKLEEKVNKLEAKLYIKDQVISEITEDYVKLKKNFGEI